MKTLILANLGKPHYSDGEMLPQCFLPLYNRMTVLDRQISLLNINGFSNEDICVMFGCDGIWNTDSVRKRVDHIQTIKLFSHKNDMLNANMFASDFFENTELLIIDGNLVFDLAIISRLKRFRKSNALVVRDLLKSDENDRTLKIENNKIIAVEYADLMDFPWVASVGIVRLSSDAVSKLRKVVISPISLMDAIDEILDDCEITPINYEDLLYGKLNGGHSNELTGGSYSKINYRLVVKKEDEGAGREKLINEIKWLKNLPSSLQPYFSEVLEYDISSQKVYYNVPYYGSRNLREHIFTGHFDANAAVSFLENLLDWMFQNVYSIKVSDAPSNWIMEKHINRVLDRLIEISEKSELLEKLVNCDRITINGVEYKNIKEIYTKIRDNVSFLEIVNPHDLVMIHGDLHFQNILIYSGTDTGFMLVDPRGELLGSDIYYDMGKLWHSFHGKYDFIHTDQFKLSLSFENEIPEANFKITNSFIEAVYDEIYVKFLHMITKYDVIRKDPNWEMKAMFAEASHFCSVSTFHIGKTKTSDRSVVLYLTGVKLINEFYDKYLSKHVISRT